MGLNRKLFSGGARRPCRAIRGRAARQGRLALPDQIKFRNCLWSRGALTPVSFPYIDRGGVRAPRLQEVRPTTGQ